MTTMLDSLANEIEAACRVRAYGLYDYSSYRAEPGALKAHVVRDELTRNAQVVFESDDPAEARQWYEIACRRFIARAALQAIREIDPDIMLRVQWGRVPDRIQAYWSDTISAILEEKPE